MNTHTISISPKMVKSMQYHAIVPKMHDGLRITVMTNLGNSTLLARTIDNVVEKDALIMNPREVIDVLPQLVKYNSRLSYYINHRAKIYGGFITATGGWTYYLGLRMRI